MTFLYGADRRELCPTCQSPWIKQNPRCQYCGYEHDLYKWLDKDAEFQEDDWEEDEDEEDEE